MRCSLAYQVQTREAKLLSDIFVLFLMDSSCWQGVSCKKAKFSMVLGCIAPFQCVQI